MMRRSSGSGVSISPGQDIAEPVIEGKLAHSAEPLSATRAPALVMAGAGALLFGCFGIAYAAPVFFAALSRHLVIPLPHLTALFSAAGALYLSLGVISGPLADRIGAHIVAVPGCAVLAGGLIVMSRARGEPVFDIGYLFWVGTGVGRCFVSAVGAVQGLCRNNPAVAGALRPPGSAAARWSTSLALLIGHIGWRQTWRLLGVLAACGGLATLPLAGSRAVNDRGHVPDSAASPPQLAELLRSHRFLLLYGTQLIVSLVAFVPFAHLVLFAKAMGWPATTGGYLIGMMGIGSLCGRLLLGFVAQSLGSSCRAASLCTLVMAVALALLLLTTNHWEPDGDAALYGLGYGGVIGLTGPIVAKTLGGCGISSSVGFVTTSRALGILVGRRRSA